MSTLPTKKAYVAKFPFITHYTMDDYIIDPVFNPDFNDWYWNTPSNTHHPINSLLRQINPFRNLFAELVTTGKVTWDGLIYTIADSYSFWQTCKKYNINPKFPPTPVFTAPTGDQYCFKALAEYYNLFGTYNHIISTDFWNPFNNPKPLRPLSKQFQFQLSVKPAFYLKRRYCPECSDTSTSDEPQDSKPNKRIKKEDEDP